MIAREEAAAKLDTARATLEQLRQNIANAQAQVSGLIGYIQALEEVCADPDEAPHGEPDAAPAEATAAT